jgi:hypothetical protein
MTDKDDTSRWSWMDASGVEISGDEWDLLAALKSGEITPETLVWRRTWLDWLPASRVAELSHLLPPGAALAPMSPRRSENAERPPPRILEVAPPNAPSSFGTFGQRTVLGVPRPLGASRPARAAQPTLDEEYEDPRGTLRPPGAVPPPPRAVAGAGTMPHLPRAAAVNTTIAITPSGGGLGQTAILGPRRPQPTLVGVGSMAGHIPPPPPAFGQTMRLGEPPRPVVPAIAPPVPAPAALAPLSQTLPLQAGPPIALSSPAVPLPVAQVLPPAVHYAPLPNATLPHHAESAQPSSPSRTHAVETPLAEGSERAKGRASAGRYLWAGGAAVLLAAAAFASIFVKQRSSEAAAQVASALPATAAAKKAVDKSVGCQLLHPAARLAPDFYRRVTPVFALSPNGDRVAVGFAETQRKAIGLVVHPESLASEQSFSQETKAQVSAVVPRFADGKPVFVVDADRGTLRGTRSIAGAELAVALSGADLVQATETEPKLLFKDAAPGKSTDPRVASSAAGHLVTFRRGGLQGDVAYAFLGPRGAPEGELGVLRSEESAMSGTPDGALLDDRFLIAFAGRATNDTPWQVFLATGKRNASVPPISKFTTPAGGLGGGSIAPAVAALGGGLWVLTWTEGKAPKYEVRLQALGADLKPRGEPLLASPKGANAGQASLFAVGETIFSVFVQSTAGHDELWAATFRCQ